MKFTRYYVTDCYNDAITLPPTDIPIMLLLADTTSVTWGMLKADWDYEILTLVSFDGSIEYNISFDKRDIIYGYFLLEEGV
jgi:hypothetical protein